MSQMLFSSIDLTISLRDPHIGTKGEVVLFGDPSSGLSDPQASIPSLFLALLSLFATECPCFP